MIRCHIPAFFIIQWRWCSLYSGAGARSMFQSGHSLQNDMLTCFKKHENSVKIATFGDCGPLNLKKIALEK